MCIGGRPKNAPGKGIGLGPGAGIGGRPAGRGGGCRGRGGAAPPMSRSVKVTSSASLLPSASASASAVGRSVDKGVNRLIHKGMQVGRVPAWYSRDRYTKA